MAREKEAAAQAAPECPQCGAGMVKNGRRQRKLKGKVGQTIELDRQQWRCLSCGATLFPLDRTLGLLRGAYTPQVQEAITRLSSRMSYREAHQEVELLWKVAISKGGMRDVTMRHGHVADALIKEKVANLEATAPAPTAEPEQMVMCTDGAMVQLTSGEWLDLDPLATFASGALLFTAAEEDGPAIRGALIAAGIDCAVIGRVEAGPPAALDVATGQPLPRPVRDEIGRVYEM